METTLIIISMLLVFYAAYCTVKFFKWRKRVNKPLPSYNKQGQECTKSEMEAELTWKLEKSLIRPIPEEEAFD